MNNPRIKVGTSELKEVFFLLWVCGRNVAIICGSEHTIRQTINTIYIYFLKPLLLLQNSILQNITYDARLTTLLYLQNNTYDTYKVGYSY